MPWSSEYCAGRLAAARFFVGQVWVLGGVAYGPAAQSDQSEHHNHVFQQFRRLSNYASLAKASPCVGRQLHRIVEGYL